MISLFRFVPIVYSLIRCYLWVAWTEIRGVFTTEPNWWAENELHKDGSWKIYARQISFDDPKEKIFLELPPRRTK